MQDSSHWHIETIVAQSADHMQMVTAVRGAVFLAENEWAQMATFSGEFHANDFNATHILTLVNGDPAGIMRIRWFRDFAIMERIGIRARYRSYAVFVDLSEFAVQHIREKGYTKIAGRAYGKTWQMWKRLIGATRSGPCMTIDRGHLWPMIVEKSPLADSVSDLAFGTPEVEELITQREGQWDFCLIRRAQESAA
jgi:hypothetical protein